MTDKTLKCRPASLGIFESQCGTKHRVKIDSEEGSDGITKINQPRVYPTRKGESIMDIIEPRQIAFEDVKKLNPGVNLGTFNKGEKLKLPPGSTRCGRRRCCKGAGSCRPRASTRYSLCRLRTRSTSSRESRGPGCTRSTSPRA